MKKLSKYLLAGVGIVVVAAIGTLTVMKAPPWFIALAFVFVCIGLSQADQSKTPRNVYNKSRT